MCDVSVNIARFYAKLRQFRETEKYVDVSIQCGSRTFRCHRLALAVASEYFDAMFAGSFSESMAANVVLQEVEAETFEQVLNFAYTGDVTINSGNVGNLFRASDFFGLPNVEERCAKFVETRSSLTVENILDIFNFACRTGRNELKRLVSVYIAENFDSVYRTNVFLHLTLEDLMQILDQYCVQITRNEDTLLNAVIRWVRHEHAQRFQHLDKVWKMIRWQNVSIQFTKLMAEEMIVLPDPVRPRTRQIIDTVDHIENTAPLKATLNPATSLHIYVRYPRERKDRIFSINGTGQCTISGEVPITRDTRLGICNVGTLDNSCLYCLNFCGDKYYHGYSQTFSTFTSIDRRSPLALTPPPVVLESLPHMCHIPNNIYMYRRFFWDEYYNYNSTSIIRTNAPNNLNIFSDEEINRNIYAYNCNTDRWFPVPPAKKLLKCSSMTSCDNVVYLIGGEDQTFVQAYDVRTKAWQELPRTMRKCENAACCVLDGKIYVVCGKSAQKFDPTAGKWEKIASTNADSQYQLVKSYSGKIWAMKGDYGRRKGHLNLDIYCPSLNTWSDSSIILGLASKMTAYYSEIVDCVAFK